MRRPPQYEPRRQTVFEAELRARAKVWLPEWRPRGSTEDFAGAILKIAARFASEVAQRLDRMPEKNFRGFLHWLGVRGAAARAARIPVVLQMAPESKPVRADPPVQFQALGAAEPVMFETTEPLTLTSATLQAVLGAEPAADHYFLPPAAILSLEPPPALPTQWELISDAEAGALWLQLEPALGLEAGTIIASASGAQYTIVDIKGGLVKIEPPLDAALNAKDRVSRVARFDPFAATTRNAQEHAIYIGAKAAFSIESQAVIELEGWAGFGAELEWAYWGKETDAAEAGWVLLQRVPEGPQLLLLKNAGKLEETEISGRKSLWLRAWKKELPRDVGKLTPLGPVRLLVNCVDKRWPERVSKHYPKDPPPPVRKVEGIANSTPLVLNTAFYPFGREPRLFDAFYLGSREAFSKPNARVRLAFTFGDEWASEPVVASVSATQHLLCGMSADGALRIVTITGTAGADPKVTFYAASQPLDSQNHPIPLVATARPAIAANGTLICVAGSSAQGECFLWQGEFASPDKGGWTSLGSPGGASASAAEASSAADIQTAITLANGTRIYAVSGGQLFQCDFVGTRTWTRLDTTYAGASITLTRIVPILAAGSAGSAGTADELLGIADDGHAYMRIGSPMWQRVTPGARRFHSASYPIAVRVGASDVRCWAAVLPPPDEQVAQLAAFEVDVSAAPFAVGPDIIADVALAGEGLTTIQMAGGPVVAFVASDGGVSVAGHWDAFAAASEPPILGDALGPASVRQRGAVAFDGWFAVPAPRGNIWLMQVDPALHEVIGAALIRTVVIAAAGSLAAGNLYVLDLTPDLALGKTFSRVRHIESLSDGSQAIFLQPMQRHFSGTMDSDAYTEATPDLFAVHPAAGAAYETVLPNAVTVAVGDFVRVKWGPGPANAAFAQLSVVEPDVVTHFTTLEFREPLPPAAAGLNLDVTPLRFSKTLPGLARPGMHSAKLQNDALVRDGTFTVKALGFYRQHALRVPVASGWVVIAEDWVLPPAGAGHPQVIADAVISRMSSYGPPAGHNPDLSWEYWDGSGWWQIANVADGTNDLIATGAVEFCVPSNIAETDVAGHKNFWVRARLIGGDYGQESVSIVSTPPLVAGGSSTQTVTRSADDIRAPHVIALSVSYSICCPTLPDFVLTRDGGTLIDQSAANRSAGAFIETLRPLRSSIDAGDRALFLGFDTAPTGKALTLMFLLDEGEHSDAFPVRVDARRAHGFEPVTVADRTHGLNESGTLTLSFNDPPVQAEYFGRSLFWLRIRPRDGFDDPGRWRPVIRSVFTNAVWARSTETQSGEMLGTSDGRPGLEVSLARPPVIAKTLQLRIRERVSDEDMAELNRKAPGTVQEGSGDRTGRWVLWQEAPDLLDASPTDRVYVLDDVLGTITFGDARHGMIPPVGRDSILAESYVRGGGEAANAIRAFGEANLITPLAGVDRVVLVGDAAGGSDPESAERTLRFASAKVYQRDRILTLADLETAALEFSPDIAQAVALNRQHRIELFLAMRGPDPRPSAALRRELEANLRDRVSPNLAAVGSIVAQRVEVVPTRVALTVTIDDLEYAGQVADECAQRVTTLFDPAMGGLDGAGWLCGARPDEADLAACLDGVDHLEELLSVDLECVQNSALVALPSALRPQELIVLTPDGVDVRVRDAAAAETAS